MKIIFSVLLLLTIASVADCQTAPSGRDTIAIGIHFESGLSWKNVLEKAKQENKYIFVDCFATWCVPCKKMESEVYTLKDVGDFFNKDFISVKMQMDSAQNDNDIIKALYADAYYVRKKYKVRAYPTYLFFNPNGQILKTGIGEMRANDFVDFAKTAIDPQNDYYRMLSDYQKNKRDIKEMSYLSRTALELLHDTVQADNIAKTYLSTLSKDDWYIKENIEFMHEFTRSSKDIGFTFFYRHADTIDKVVAIPGYAEGLVAGIIAKEIVSPLIKKARQIGKEPVWSALADLIGEKYGKYYSKRIVLGAQIEWYGRTKDWPNWSTCYVAFQNRYAINLTSQNIWNLVFINNCAWTVFNYSNDKKALNAALNWSSRAVLMNPDPTWIDTYANILYKLGQNDLAIKWESVAVKQAGNNKEFESTLEKMKNKLPTWPQN